MTQSRRADRPGGWQKKIKATLVKVASVSLSILSLLPVVTPMAKNVYQNHFVPPKIQCTPGEEQDTFKVPDEFRAVKLTLKAQVIIQCGIHVMSIITVENFYENEVVIFEGNSGVAKKRSQKQVDHLRVHIDQEIRRALTETYGEEIFQKIGPLNVYFSLLGGTEYQNLRGNTRYRQCIISQDGLVQDYSEDEQIIAKRMDTIHLQIKDTSEAIDEDEKIDEIIQDTVNRIDVRLISKTNWKLSDLFEKIPTFFQSGLLWAVFLLCLSIAAYVGWIIIVQVVYYLRQQSFQRKQKFPWKKVFVCFVIMAAVDWAGFSTAKALTRTEDEKLAYEESPLAEQEFTKELFDPPLPKEDEEANGKSTLEKLHILKMFVGVKVSSAMLAAYKSELRPVYQNGSGDPPDESVLPWWFDMTGDSYSALSETAFDNIEDQKITCSESVDPPDLYQLEKALTEGVLLEYPRMDFENVLDIAADGVACGEEFLAYRDRNINTDKDPFFMNAEDVALLNGKLYWILGDCAENGNVPEEYRQYKDSFYAAGFQCMALGIGFINKNDHDYAKMSYYMGNFSQRMLKNLTEEDEYFQELGKNAMKYYEEALHLLQHGSVRYNVEDNMKRNIEKGITTLEELGFVRLYPSVAEN